MRLGVRGVFRNHPNSCFGISLTAATHGSEPTRFDDFLELAKRTDREYDTLRGSYLLGYPNQFAIHYFLSVHGWDGFGYRDAVLNLWNVLFNLHAIHSEPVVRLEAKGATPRTVVDEPHVSAVIVFLLNAPLAVSDNACDSRQLSHAV